MKTEPMHLSTYELLAQYMYYKLITGGENSCTKKEFETMLERIKEHAYCSDKQKRITFDEPSFEKAAQNCIEKFLTLKDKSQFEFEKGIIKANYNFNRLKIKKEGLLFGSYFDIPFNMELCIRKLAKDANQTAKPERLNFNPSPEELSFAKKVSAYVTANVAEKYIAGKENWPKGYANLKYIFEKDLATPLEMEGTKDNFKKIYKNGTIVVLKLVKFQQKFIIEDYIENGFLGYNNFYRMISASPSQELKLMHSASGRDNACTINVEDLKANVKQKTFTCYDPFEGKGKLETTENTITPQTPPNIVEKTFG